jgi:molybdenum storage protein
MTTRPERREIESRLADSTLSGHHGDGPGAGGNVPIHAILPQAKVIKIGGQSVMDRGRAALFPLVEEIAEASKSFPLLLGAGGGTRARHAYAIGIDLGVPTGVMARVGGAVPRQNARILQMLLAKHGGIYIMHDDFEKLPLYFRLGCIPIMTGMPPNEYWEKPAEGSTIPDNRTDAGVFLAAEALGCPTVYFLKDEKGLYTNDPKKDKHATFIPRIHAQELIDRDLDDLVIERVVVRYLLRAKACKEVHVFNGLEPGNLRRALSGEHVGTIIHA